jgi:uncharacterized DUF497 family protein
MHFEWDHRKAAANARKHGVTFEEAASVFGDPLALTFDDPDHSSGEYRMLTFGVAAYGGLIVVAHTERDGNVRIISARPATAAERKIYEQG